MDPNTRQEILRVACIFFATMAENVNLMKPRSRSCPYASYRAASHTCGACYMHCSYLHFMNTATPIYRVVSSHEEALAASAAKSKLTQELEAAAVRNEELCQTAKDKEKEFQVRHVDSLLRFPST